MQTNDRINKLCELYNDLPDWHSIMVDSYRVYRDGWYFSFEKEDSIAIRRSMFNSTEFTTQNPSEIQSEIESLLKYFEESHINFIDR